MEWEAMRAHFRDLLTHAKRDKGESQLSVAARGGIQQNKISNFLKIKKLKSKDLGPSVETFIRAIEGLDMTASEFFLQLEKKNRQDHDIPVLTSLPQHGKTVTPPAIPKGLGQHASTVRSAVASTDADASAGLVRSIAVFLLNATAAAEAEQSDRKVRRARGKKTRRR
jgi:transcriptional regulator with XRE-family HTH domain